MRARLQRVVHAPRRGLGGAHRSWAWLPLLAPAYQVPFSEEALERGVEYAVAPSSTSGHGVALCDLDGDLDLDLVTLGRFDGVIGVFENDGSGHFTDRSLTSGLAPLIPGTASGVVAADYDGDGRIDLYFSNANAADRLVRNLGGLVFKDVTAEAGLGDFGFGVGSCWADFDGDGDLDLHLANNTKLSNPSPDKLYRNDAGVFVVVEAGLHHRDLAAWQSVFFDYDRDGDPDLYVSNDKGTPGTEKHNYMWKNVGGTFVDATFETQTQAHIDSMGVAIGDFDGNGYSDIYCTNIGANPLFLNTGNGPFVNVAFQAGVTSDSVGWGTLFFDFDNDGDLDLYACNAGDKDRLYEFDGQFPCRDVAQPMGLSYPLYSYCVAAGDIDRDGDLDLVHSAYFAPIRLFINQNTSHVNWLQVHLEGKPGNRSAVGAWVRVTSGGKQQSQQVLAGVGYKSSSPFQLHFGLGFSEVVEEVRVFWPGGGQSVLQNAPINRLVRLRHLPPYDVAPEDT